MDAAILHNLIHGDLVEDCFGEAVQTIATVIIFDGRVGVSGLDCLHKTGVVGEKGAPVSCGRVRTGGGTGAP